LIGVEAPPKVGQKPAATPTPKPAAKPASASEDKVDPHAVLSKAEIMYLQEIFALFDKDGSSSITVHELAKMMSGLGKDVPVAALRDMIATVDADGNGAIDSDEFLFIMVRDAAQRDPYADAMRSFSLFDADGSGTISALELGAALRASGHDVSDDAAARDRSHYQPGCGPCPAGLG
jgi:Ca2+-binding EF-hand superfamily protein